MTAFDRDVPPPEAAQTEPPAEPEEQFPARRLLAHDADDSWLLDDGPGWRPID